MTNNAEDTKNGSNNGNDGFVWSQRLTFITGTAIAIALAAAHFVPILAASIGWSP